MPLLQVQLRDGFVGERVVVALDGRVILDEGDVRLRPQIGIARLVEDEVPARALDVRVALPDRGTAASLRVDPTRTPAVAVTVGDDGVPSLTPEDAPRGYL
jgi:hypothetical protein